MILYFIYVRKSSEDDEHQILSIDAQLDEVRAYAREHNLTVVKEFVESQSARSPGRPEFNEMMRQINAGVATGILAWNPDRLARNWEDGGKIMTALDMGKIAMLKFPNHWYENTPQGKLMLSHAFGYAKFYTDNLSVNINRGIRKKLSLGQFPGKAPIGYINEPKLRIIVRHRQRFNKVKSILELIATGNYSLVDIQRRMTALKLVGARSKKPLSFSSIHKMLTNPFYYGAFLYRGELHQGSHEPMISKDCYDRIQKALKSIGKPHIRNRRGPKPFFLLGLARCQGCGYGITAERHIKRSGRQFIYYRCTKRSKKVNCPAPYVRDSVFLAEITRNAQLLGVTDEWRSRFLARIDQWELEGHASVSGLVTSLTAKQQLTATKIKRLIDLYVDSGEGSMTLEEFNEKKNALTNEKIIIEEKLKNARANLNRLEPVRNWVNAANAAYNRGLSENPKEMLALLKETGSNHLLWAGTLTSEFKKPWNSLAETVVFARSAAPESAVTAKWWRRGELNPCPKQTNQPRLHA